MLLSHLFEKLNPGERRRIELKIKDAQEALRNIERHKDKLSNLNYLPTIPGTEKEFEDLKQAYQSYIDTLKEKLKQDDAQKKKDPLETYLKAIIRHCPTVVNTCKKTGKLLYRGTKESAPAFYGKPFDYRKAKDSHSEYSEAFNYALEQAGAVARRDNSIFCTTNRNFASGFGHELYIVFPRDPFHFTWSDKIKDLIINSDNMGDIADPDVVDNIMDQIWNNDEAKASFLKDLGYLTGRDVSTWEYSPLMFNVRDYGIFTQYHFSYSFSAAQKAIDYLPDEYKKYKEFKYWASPENVVKNFGIHIDEDLEGAFKKRYEITVRGDYYAVHSKYEKQVMKYLQMGDEIDNDI